MVAKKTAKKTTKKVVKKAAKKATKKKTTKKASPGVKTVKADKRETAEHGSIAPASAGLVDAFARFRKPARRVVTGAPKVARLAPGASLPKPPEIKKPAAPAPVAAKPPVTDMPKLPSSATPLPNAAAAQLAPEAKPVQPAAKTEPVTPAPPAPPATPVAPATPASKAPATPPPAEPKKETPKATYQMPAQPKATYQMPAAGQRPPSMYRPPSGPPKKKKGPGRRARRKAERQSLQSGGQAFPSHRGAPVAQPQEGELKPLEVTSLLTVRELAEKMSVHHAEVIKKLMQSGVYMTINQRIDGETAALIASEFGWDLSMKALHMEEEIATKKGDEIEEKPEDLKPRCAVVTVMGHVDHGKTSLLDVIREADVVSGESGGITQHIGAYKVKTKKGEIVFLDTPGHEAFTAMRSRGSKITDLVILVVSSADGVMPQTLEAIDHAKEAGVPIIVAVNKIDLPTANPEKIRQDLAQRGLNPEEWGGDTIYVDVSAKKKLNIDKLLDTIALQSEMLELKANPDRPGVGVVVESEMDKKRGAVATVLIQKGTVRVGDPFVMGLGGGKVKALINEHGDRLKEAGPSTPVEILGLTGNTPHAGDTFNVVESERMAREVIEKRNRIHREESLAHKQHVSLLNVHSTHAKELGIILKADVQGSIEVLKDSIEKMSNTEIQVRVVHAGLGSVNESDILLATASNAIVLTFHTKLDTRAKELAEKDGVEVRSYEVIYELVEDVKAALEGLLEPEIVEVQVGKVEVRQVFKIRGAQVAGSYVLEGKVVRGGKVKITRDGLEIGEGKIETLKRFKDDVKEVEKSMECGIEVGGIKVWKVGDQLEIFVEEKRVRRLEALS
ncbi:MAG: translation initiation factor IF-2 [Elusimicrobia bacterium]|nr:MAG: translation initiation factor IF-2 [Elusimicrobiota bacterium]